MACGTCGPSIDPGQAAMYKALETKVKAEEAEKKRLEREKQGNRGGAVEGEGEGECIAIAFAISQENIENWISAYLADWGLWDGH